MAVFGAQAQSFFIEKHARCDGVSARGRAAFVSRGALAVFIVPVKMSTSTWSTRSHGGDLSEVARVVVLTDTVGFLLTLSLNRLYRGHFWLIQTAVRQSLTWITCLPVI